MRIRTRLGTTAVAIALVAGIGVSAAPAQAKTTTKVSGTSSLALLPAVISSLSLSGVQFDATEPATSAGDGASSKTLIFPFTGAPKDGVLPLAGGMSIGASLARLYLTAPRLEFATTAGATSGHIAFEVTSMPADGPADLASGTRITLFDVPQLTIKTSKGRTAKVGKAWTRTDTQRLTGAVYQADDTSLLTSINSYVGTTFFTPALPFGTLDTVITTKVTCTTRAECK